MVAEVPPPDERIVRVPLPIRLIRRMDESIVAGRGGFQTRAELMREAVDNLLNELEFPEAPGEPVAAAASRSQTEHASATNGDGGAGLKANLLAGVPDWEREELTLANLAATTLTAPEMSPYLIESGVAQVRDEPLLGLHNRDYVSIWALHRLARYTADGPVNFEDYLRQVTKAAWFFGAQLQALEHRDEGRKLTVLLPTNSAKQPSAERGFQSFAIGGLSRPTSNGVLPASGPLFAWQAIQVGEGDVMPTGLTEHGWRLVRDLNGISLHLPHQPEHTNRFLAFLAEHAPGDRWGFDYLLQVVADGPDRDELVKSFKASHPHWSPSKASSIAQGYVARSREWGIVEPRLVEGRYWLTDAGRALAQQLD